MQGMSFDEIAVELGFADRSGAWRAAQRCLARRQQVAADRYIASSFADLEIIQERAWPRAAAGDLAAGRIVMRAIEDQVRLVEVLSTRESTATAEMSPWKVGRREPEAGYFASMVV